MMNQPHTIYNTAAEAQAVADANNTNAQEQDGDDAWTYNVNVDEVSGRAVIEIIDTEGFSLGLL